MCHLYQNLVFSILPTQGIYAFCMTVPKNNDYLRKQCKIYICTRKEMCWLYYRKRSFKYSLEKAGLSSQRAGFNPRPVRVRIVVDRVSLKQVFSEYFGLPMSAAAFRIHPHVHGAFCTRVVPKVMSNLFACDLGTADEGECGGRWNQLLCYP